MSNDFTIYRYSRSMNLGDAVQSIALARLLPGKIGTIDRGGFQENEIGGTLVINGWLGRNAMAQGRDCLFAGVHLAEPKNLDWFQQSSFPVGSRDPWTQARVREQGLDAQMSLCATLTFEKYTGVRRGVYEVDWSGKGISAPRTRVRVSHWIAEELPWPDQWALGLHLLDLYRRAEAVYTDRLHVALPCLAFGTPVFLSAPQRLEAQPGDYARRFGTTEALGIRFDEVNEIDVSAAAAGYRRFLETHLHLSTVSKPLEHLSHS